MDIMFINKQALFATIEKDVRFQGLVPLDNRTKKDIYGALDVVMRRYKTKYLPLNALNVTASLNQL